ncbi:amidase [Jannaschia sp. Os4]|uniref:amidase n=1 Tax=Jannaschia sp. Os4 TaxID=2807617 RepID=UPI00193A53CE|nr:amidase [Jannaschia sp. Os4]MBM2575177.1 amidase [Jannaschia sp. Os4]
MDLLDRPAADQIAALRDGAVAAPDLMAATLDRIEASRINAVVSLRDRDALMAEAAVPRPGPLAGLPMAVKDLADTAGLRTTYGHPRFADHVPEADAPLVARLRAAGAIVIGKTNTPEYGLGSHTTNPVHGPTLNPWDRGRSAGGSSGGAGAALAARLVALADGSDMMGSLRNPAVWNGVYGLRPSHGLVPGTPGPDAFLHPLSTDGPMARTPEDLRLLLDVLAADAPASPWAARPRAPAPERWTLAWTPDWDGWAVEPEVVALCEAGLSALAAQGHNVVRFAPPLPAEEAWSAWITLRSWAIAEKLRPLWTDDFAAASKPALVWEVERGLRLTAAEVHAASVTRTALFRALHAMEADALVTPAAALMPFPVGWDWPRAVAGREMDTYHRWMEPVIPASLAGLPSLALPTGSVEGRPNGLQVTARRGWDHALIDLAARFEAEMRWSARVPPSA